MANPRTCIYPSPKTFHHLRRSTFLLTALILAAILSSCGLNRAPQTDPANRQESASTCSQTDGAALAALFNATDGPNWRNNTNWLSQQPLSTWHGVTTAEDGCLIRLNLKENNLTGQLPPELGTLPKLRYLNLRDNNLSGRFPQEWANAASMTHLYVSGNNFSGCFPRQFARLQTPLLRGLLDLVTDTASISNTDIPLSYCSPADSDDPHGTFQLNTALNTPQHLSYTFQDTSIVLRWDPVADADRYILYHDAVSESRCRVSDAGFAHFCEPLATVRGETTYTHVDAPGGRNFYWIRACNNDGCSPLITENAAKPPADAPVRTGIDYPLVPANLTYAFEGDAIILSWDPVAVADYYNLYHHHSFPTYCNVAGDGTASFCDLLAANITATAYTHTDPQRRTNFWVAACNSTGCSPFEGESPIKPVVALPATPANISYAREGSAAIVRWDPVENADYYILYHDDFFDSACRVSPEGETSFCAELAAKLVDTTYLHSDPGEDSNFYWVAACNRAGCSQIEGVSPTK